MKKQFILNKIAESKLVAVIRAKTADEALKICNACAKGGITAIEVTFTIDFAHDVIKELKQKLNDSDIIIGAGTVLDAVTARVAILNGADFIVSPSFDPETAKVCNLYQIPYLPGCFTTSEIVAAMKAGCDIVKLFPGNLAGPDYVKAIKGPLPHANIMPTGGVNLSNVDEWIKAGSVAVGIGGQLTKPALTGDYDQITVLA
ncbi:MAG TPA: bifunctional 2-keto-4-hydroxyglutarate aldolase/2-keto-3-deoxy-6-phosphogluconate aldolase, partial [Bacilli bacterium]|nr:bifunctional 2-keto-4-hydroxyglutarate aldolase/2-keto-3-deoxy-6-phosphogluconate aldolase [Bacilli bacterium]